MGLKVALDDFGSGQSSLSYVHQLSLDKIKIDRGFIRNIAMQENARNIVKTVIDLCRNLKFDCMVEGVETAEQVEIIGLLGCSTMQGYFFAKPMPQGDVETFIASYRMSGHPRMAAVAG
jgi:EAL domain-containing protein (putative c-di-GMP-specific phosphodiesterase class I)